MTVTTLLVLSSSLGSLQRYDTEKGVGMDAKSKTCSKCGEEKLLDEFHIDKTRKDGRRSRCKLCVRKYCQDNKEKIAAQAKRYYQANRETKIEYSRQHRQDNKEKIKQYRQKNKEKHSRLSRDYYKNNQEKIAARGKQYYQDNKERIRERHKQYYQDDKEETAARGKQYYQDNKEKIKQYRQDNKEKIAAKAKQWHQANKERQNKRSRDYYKKNKEKIAAQAKRYYQDNKERRNEYRNEYVKNRLKNDEQFRIRYYLSTALRKSLKTAKTTKKNSTLNYIGCSIESLQEHLNSTKKPDWGDNLHIDHIIPSSLFDHTNEEEIKKCWNWRNLRYLPAEKNMSKKDKLDMDLVKSYGIEDLLPEGVDK